MDITQIDSAGAFFTFVNEVFGDDSMSVPKVQMALKYFRENISSFSDEEIFRVWRIFYNDSITISGTRELMIHEITMAMVVHLEGLKGNYRLEQ